MSILEELDQLVGAGLTPTEALRTATWEPARYFNALDSLGTVAPGRLADLVLLDADPTTDVRATRRIAAVWTSGRMIAGAERARILGAAEAAAKAP